MLVALAACAAAPVVAHSDPSPRLRDYDAADPVFPSIDFSDVREIPPEDIMHPPQIEKPGTCTNPAPLADVDDDFQRTWFGCGLTEVGEGVLPAESIRVLVLPSFDAPVMARVTTIGATHQLVVASKSSRRKRALVDAEWQRLQHAITDAQLEKITTADMLQDDMAHADGTVFVIETLRHGVHRIVHRNTPGGTYLALVDLVFAF